jgi:hypothetical protein
MAAHQQDLVNETPVIGVSREDREMTNTADSLYRLAVERRVADENAQREREIRADLIEDVREAIKAESERLGQEVGAVVDVDEAFATVAVDAVADYYRRAAKRFT